jgi:hypothetical protein
VHGIASFLLAQLDFETPGLPEGVSDPLRAFRHADRSGVLARRGEGVTPIGDAQLFVANPYIYTL